MYVYIYSCKGTDTYTGQCSEFAADFCAKPAWRGESFMDPGKSADGRKMYFRTLDDSMRATERKIGTALRL